MRLSEITIIYFAAAAPFGVAHFLRRPARGARRVKALSGAAGAALLWPLTVLLLLLERAGAQADARDAGAEAQDGAFDERRIERSKRELTNALREVEDVLDEGEGEVPDDGRNERRDDALNTARGVGREARRFALYSARECVERYVGLALACAGARKDADPSERELELCRLAGGAGDDLLLAGRCIHRRNVSRLFAHRERARAELIHALAGVREEAGRLRADTPDESFNAAARRASEPLLRALARAVELLSLLEDEEAARRVARLLDAECARLRRLEAAGADGAPEERRKGAQPCTTRAAHRAFATPLLRTTTSRHG
jgi:hypothetical protein